MRTGDNIRLRADGRYEARFIKGKKKDGKIQYGYSYGKTYDEAKEKRSWQLAKLNKHITPRLMNLLILGAGSHGREIFEIAEGLRVFNKIAFLDDNKEGANIIGKWQQLEQFYADYPLAIAGVGNSELRKRCHEELVSLGFVIPTLIDTTAVVSKDAVIGYGTVICAKAVVNVGSSVGKGCIVSSGAVVARDAEMKDWSFINSGETLLKTGEIK